MSCRRWTRPWTGDPTLRRGSGGNDARLIERASRPRRTIRDGDAKVEPLGAAENAHRCGRADARPGQEAVQVVQAGDRRRVERDDDVALAEPRGLRRGVGFDRDHEHAGCLGQAMEAGHAAKKRYVLAGHSEIAPPHVAVRSSDGSTAATVPIGTAKLSPWPPAIIAVLT